tara:strand:- start:7681 stop:7887 length:207 start_codon:yes stop_codon:yes gene_type:complete
MEGRVPSRPVVVRWTTRVEMELDLPTSQTLHYVPFANAWPDYGRPGSIPAIGGAFDDAGRDGTRPSNI